MSEIKHTPGPWKAVGDYPTSIVAGNICVAVTEGDGEYAAPHDQQQHNANLIAAAPDLLAALKRYVELTRGDTIRVLSDGRQNLIDALTNAHSAIAKAKGEA